MSAPGHWQTFWAQAGSVRFQREIRHSERRIGHSGLNVGKRMQSGHTWSPLGMVATSPEVPFGCSGLY